MLRLCDCNTVNRKEWPSYITIIEISIFTFINTDNNLTMKTSYHYTSSIPMYAIINTEIVTRKVILPKNSMSLLIFIFEKV